MVEHLLLSGVEEERWYLAGGLNTWKSIKYTGLDLVNMYVMATAVTKRQQDTKLTCDNGGFSLLRKC